MSISFDNAVFAAVILTDAVVIVLLIYRRVWRILPVFCSYVVWDILSDIVVYSVMRHYPSKYFDTYFIQIAIDSAFLVCVMVEIAWSTLRPIQASLSRGVLVIVAVLILAAGAAIWPFAAVPALAHDSSRQWLFMVQLQQTVSILRILLFLILAAGSELLSIGWRDRELQVAAGLGFYSLVSVVVSILQAHQNTHLQWSRLERWASLAALCSLFYWIFSFSQKEAARREFTPQMESFLLAMAGAARTTRVALTESRTNKPRKHDDQ